MTLIKFFYYNKLLFNINITQKNNLKKDILTLLFDI